MSIKAIENEIKNLVDEVVAIKAYYDYPVADIGRNLPALVNIMTDLIKKRKRSKIQTQLITLSLHCICQPKGKL